MATLEAKKAKAEAKAAEEAKKTEAEAVLKKLLATMPCRHAAPHTVTKNTHFEFSKKVLHKQKE